MSGLVAVFGSNNNEACRAMLSRITHRGPDIYGFADMGRGVIGQNYLPADVHAVYDRQGVPVMTGEPVQTVIGYDGQIGDREALAAQWGVGGDAFLEERLLLGLYARRGTDLFTQLKDAVFSFVIMDDQGGLLAARDLLGIKTLFYARKNDVFYLASEMKAILAVSEEVYEFPAGHYLTAGGEFIAFDSLKDAPPEPARSNETESRLIVKQVIEDSVDQRIDFRFATGSLLSGGIDSSVIAMLAARRLKKKYGSTARLDTFALGVGESEDIINARIVSEAIDSRHHELIVGLDDVLEVLDQVIYYLESFDPSLVRSAVSNYLISRFARQNGVEVLLSGEGGDEVFCGYLFLKQLSPASLHKGQIDCLKRLHNNASLRLDRMNQCHQVRVVAPLISGPLLDIALALSPELKQKPDGDQQIEKYIFRKAFENDLPARIVWRLKQEFSQGSGSAALLSGYFEKTVDDKAFSDIQQAFPMVRGKEELFYFNLFTKHFGARTAINTVGQWFSL